MSISTPGTPAQDPRITELLDLASSGLKLPYSPKAITQFEDAGFVVDLDTGAIVPNGTDKPVGALVGALLQASRRQSA